MKKIEAVVLPSKEKDVIYESGTELAEVEGILEYGKIAGYTVITCSSGTYIFRNS